MLVTFQLHCGENFTLQILTCFIWFPTLTEVEKQPLCQIFYPVLCFISPFSTNNLCQYRSDRFDSNWKKRERAILFSFQKLLSIFEGFQQLMNLPEYLPVFFIQEDIIWQLIINSHCCQGRLKINQAFTHRVSIPPSCDNINHHTNSLLSRTGVHVLLLFYELFKLLFGFAEVFHKTPCLLHCV
jgi:hypothetical protein